MNYSSWSEESISRKLKQNPPLVGHSVVYIILWEISYNPNHLTKQISVDLDSKHSTRLRFFLDFVYRLRDPQYRKTQT